MENSNETMNTQDNPQGLAARGRGRGRGVQGRAIPQQQQLVQRMDLLTETLTTMTQTMNQLIQVQQGRVMAQEPNRRQPWRDLEGERVAQGPNENPSEGTGENPDDLQQPAETQNRASVGSRQRRAVRRREAELRIHEVSQSQDDSVRPPRGSQGNNFPAASASTHVQGDLRDRLRARREAAQRSQGVNSTAPEDGISTQEARTLREQMANVNDVLGRIADVVNVRIEPRDSHDHPFTDEIMVTPLPDRFKAPVMALYEGKTDPDDHLEVYAGHMTLYGYPGEIMCRAFCNTLTGPARRWFRSLPPRSVSSWNDLKRKFRNQFIGVKKFVPPKQNLSVTYQGRNESLKSWLTRFGQEVASMPDITDGEALMGALSSMRKDSAFRRDLNHKQPKTYQEFLERAQGFINQEETERLVLKSTVEVPEGSGANQSGRPSKKRRGNGGQMAEVRTEPAVEARDDAKKSRRDGPKRGPQPRYDRYHELTMSVEDVYHNISDRGYLRRPEPMRSIPGRRNQTKYCRFHGEHGHLTSECVDLKDEIERLIRDGRLQQYKARQGNQRANDRRRDERPRENPPEPTAVIRSIFGGPYVGGDSRRAMKNYAREAREKYRDRFLTVSGRGAKEQRHDDAEITFSENDANGVHFPHNDALIVEVMIGNFQVCRVLVDNGSSVDILYADCLDKMGIDRSQLVPSTQPLYGFTGHSVAPEGTIKLPLTAGERPRTSTVMSNFVVIKGEGQFNAVIGRPTLRALKAVSSIYHQVVKFPTTEGTGCLKSNQYESRMTYTDAVHRYSDPRHEFRMVQNGLASVGNDIDPRLQEEGSNAGPVEDLVEIIVDDKDQPRSFKVGSQLAGEMKEQLAEFLRKSMDVFAWTHDDMEGIDAEVMSHRLNVDPKFTPKRQKRRPMNAERYEALREEVDKLIKNDFIREAKYPNWISNPVLVKKPNGKWRTCIDFSDLNKACPKDSFPLPRIDQLVDATAGHELLSFMDAYSGYNQIPMHPADEEHTSFITDRGLYCYKVMPFGLKNAGATYQRLVNKMFARQIGKTMEVYVDDMLVKSREASEHVQHLAEAFEILRMYKMKLNPLKCAFGVASGKFLGFMVSHRGIEANPEKIRALVEMRSPANKREVQKLTGCVAALNRFISKATDKCIPFFDTLRGNKRFEWTDDCELAFQKLKEYLGKPFLLSKPVPGEKLSLYLSVSEHALSSVLTRDEEKTQLPVYYTSKRLLDAETRYSEMEKLILALVVTSRRLRHYFQAHLIEVLTNHPLRQVLQKPDTSGRMLKWSVELSQFDIEYKPRSAIKGQALADFIAEFTAPATIHLDGEESDLPRWQLFVDGSSNENGSGAGMILISPDGHKITSAIRFRFKASNNEAEYEAMLAGLRLANYMKAEVISIYSDSQLVINQIKDEYQARGERMASYLRKVREELIKFRRYEMHQVPRAENSNADALARLATSKDSDLLKVIPVETLERPSIEYNTESVTLTVHADPSWMNPIVRYLLDGELPEDKLEARRLKFRATRYVLHDGLLYRRSYSSPLLRCLNQEEAAEVLKEIHEGVCGNHTGGQSLAFKVLRQGYYWPTLKRDAMEYSRKCEKCQRYGPVPRAPPEDLTSVLSPWPFAKWGIDIIGPLHRTKEGYKFAIVAVDYYTKWAEAAPLRVITEENCTNFMWTNIVCRFGVPRNLVSDNGKQFENSKTIAFCERLGISKNFSAVYHPKCNGQVEAVNKIIKVTIKRRLDSRKGKWADELPAVLWAYRTTSRTTTGETPFSMAYGVEAVLPVEVYHPTSRVVSYDEENNQSDMSCQLDLLEEKRVESQLRLAAQQSRAARYYNKKVKLRRFMEGDLVLRMAMPHTKPKNTGVLGPSWEGPFRINEVIRNGTYRLEHLDGEPIKHLWNAEHLKIYYK